MRSIRSIFFSLRSWLSLLHTRGESQTVAYHETVARLMTGIPQTDEPVLVIGYGLNHIGRELTRSLPLSRFVFVDPFLKSPVTPMIGEVISVRTFPHDHSQYEYLGPFAAIICLCSLEHIGDEEQVRTLFKRLSTKTGKVLVLGRRTQFQTLAAALYRQRLEKDVFTNITATVLFLAVTSVAVLLRSLRAGRKTIAQQLPQAVPVKSGGGFYLLYRLAYNT